MGVAQMRTDLRTGVIGRDPELALLERALAPERFPQALLITGEPGIGKTTLWHAAIDSARERGLRVLAAQPSPAEARLSLAALADLLDDVDADVLATLPAPQRRAVEVALLRADSDAGPADPRALAVGLLRVVRELGARAPLVLAVDDVQWLDVTSAGALAFAARRLASDPVCFLCTERSPATSQLARTLERNGVERVELGTLSLGATRRLLASRLGLTLPRRALLRIFEATRGNPLFALEVGRLLSGRSPLGIGAEIPVPDTLEELLGLRVARLSAPVRRVLLAVSLDADLPLTQLGAVVGAASVEDAVDAGVVLVEGDRVRAAHPLLAATVRARARERDRRDLHRELAEVVEDDELALRHLALASSGPDQALAAKLEGAARQAAARGTADAAVELAEHAHRLTPPHDADRAERVLALAEYLMVAGEHRRVLDLVTSELDCMPHGPALARAHVLLAESGWVDRHVDDSGAHLEAALGESSGDPALHATVVARLMRYAAVGKVTRIADAEAWGIAVRSTARAAGPEVEREVLHGLGWVRVLRGRPIADLADRFSAISDDVVQIFRSLDRIVPERHANRGELDVARGILERLLLLADERGEGWSYVVLRTQLCEVELRAGSWDAAERLLDEWEQSLDGELIDSPGYERCRGLLALGRGDVDVAHRRAASAVASSDARGLQWSLLESLRLRGTAALLAHDPSSAADTLRRVWAHTQREGVEDPGVFPVAPDLVEALVELGELDEALAVTVRLAELSLLLGHPWGLAAVKRSRALIALAQRRGEEEAVEELAQAAAEFGELGLRFDRARVLLVLGRSERRRRKWGASRQALEQAAAAFDEIGSPGWALEARTELARVSARPPQATGALTRAEERVVGLAMQGLMNKEIARELFLSVHTVEAHLSHSYAKLGIRSRAQLRSKLPAAKD